MKQQKKIWNMGNTSTKVIVNEVILEDMKKNRIDHVISSGNGKYWKKSDVMDRLFLP